MKNNLKTIITCILVAAILITGINTGEAITVNAATTASYVQKWGTVTMKPGDTKKVIVTDTDGNDITTKYKWTSSDKSIVKVNMDFVIQSEITECLELVVAGSGTVTLTGKAVSLLEEYQTIQLTVTVKMAGPTAKQKKCKHSWKITKKATCERAGVKTCKKCKLQQSIKRTAHKYVNVTVKDFEYDGYEYVLTCSGCDHEPGDPECTMQGDNAHSCSKKCQFVVIISTKKLGGNGITACPFPHNYVVYDEDYNSHQEAIRAGIDLMKEHFIRTNNKHYSYGDTDYPYGEHEVTKTVKACKYCGKQK